MESYASVNTQVSPSFDHHASPFMMEARGYSNSVQTKSANDTNASDTKEVRSLLNMATNKYMATRTSNYERLGQVGELAMCIMIFITALIVGTYKACTVSAPGGVSLSTEQRFGVFFNYFGIIFIAGVTALQLWSCGFERLMEAVGPLIVSIFYFVYYRSVYFSNSVGEEWFNDYINMYTSAVVWVFAYLVSPLLSWPSYDVNKISLSMVSPTKNMILATGMLGLLVSGGVSLKGNPPVPYM